MNGLYYRMLVNINHCSPAVGKRCLQSCGGRIKNLREDISRDFCIAHRVAPLYPNELSFIVERDIDTSCQQIREIS